MKNQQPRIKVRQIHLFSKSNAVIKYIEVVKMLKNTTENLTVDAPYSGKLKMGRINSRRDRTTAVIFCIFAYCCWNNTVKITVSARS